MSFRINGKSLPNSKRSINSVLVYCTRCGEKYFGLQPERSIHTLGLCIASSIGLEFCNRRLHSQHMPLPMPMPEWPHRPPA